MNMLLRFFRRRREPHRLEHDSVLSRIADGKLKLSLEAFEQVMAASAIELHEDLRPAADDDLTFRKAAPIVVTLLFLACSLFGVWQGLRAAGLL